MMAKCFPASLTLWIFLESASCRLGKRWCAANWQCNVWALQVFMAGRTNQLDATWNGKRRREEEEEYLEQKLCMTISKSRRWSC
jgi:hypothetical protein